MTISLIHLSDFHFKLNWEEDQELVLREFFSDITRVFEEKKIQKPFLIFSGDFVQSGSDKNQYEGFYNYFDPKLTELGITKNRRICVPGNHDVSQIAIQENFINHEAIVSASLNEKEFNDYTENNENNVLVSKFDNFRTFGNKFADFGIFSPSFTGSGWKIDENVGVFCLNSAICSSGGITYQGKPVIDNQRLKVNTRALQKWNLENNFKYKILLMHHPLSLLNNTFQNELEKIIVNDFNLLLCGHEHDQKFYQLIFGNKNQIRCSAPPLLTNKYAQLGYSIIQISSDNETSELYYRQWNQYHKFVLGVNFANNDTGKIILHKNGQENISRKIEDDQNLAYRIETLLSSNLDDALITFSGQPKLWLDPVLNTKSEMSSKSINDSDNSIFVELSSLISSPKSTIIKAIPQYGLTCLSRFLCKKAWVEENIFWLYLDARTIETHDVKKYIFKELDKYNLKLQDISCVILDSWSTNEKNSFLLLQKISDFFFNIPLFVMQTIDDTKLLNQAVQFPIEREFVTLYLWAHSRSEIRKIVTDYNDQKPIGDIDILLSKIISDLEVLNLPRTPLNCLILLKTSEMFFDESPVNRTEVINRILLLIFNNEEIPNYKNKPDVKDCEYVLGYYCEKMIMNQKYSFSRKEFISEIKSFCNKQMIDLEIDVVFDVLFKNHIIVRFNGDFCFRFRYWIYYFAAQRMHQNKEFAKFMLSDMRYALFPEVIEFYTGIDRKRNDAIEQLKNDLSILLDSVIDKCGFPENFNPYQYAKWEPSPEIIGKLQGELNDGINESKLPNSVKDKFADQYYNPIKPFHQEIENILEEYSLLHLMRIMRAGARALRNSDYADPENKKELLSLIINSWEQISKVMFALSPTLAEESYATFDGANFLLCGDFGTTPEERFYTLLSTIPFNITSWYKDDLNSQKMGPLLLNQTDQEENDLRKLYLLRLLIAQQPNGWKSKIQEFIFSSPKNSYYLSDIYQAMLVQYKYGFLTSSTIEDLKELIKTTLAKHSFGIKKPGKEMIRKISDTILPDRVL